MKDKRQRTVEIIMGTTGVKKDDPRTGDSHFGLYQFKKPREWMRISNFNGGYIRACEHMAKEFAKGLRPGTTYTLTNGQGVSYETYERFDCDDMPEDGVKRFRETLEEVLNSCLQTH